MGEPALVARIAMLYLQSFDYHATNALPYRKFDYVTLSTWLRSIQSLDPLSGYPLFSAARVYAEVADAAKQRVMLDLIYDQFLFDPDRRWPEAAQAAMIAKHRLKDLLFALKFAHAIGSFAKAADVPLWAKQMGLFILEDMNEIDAARIMLGGLIANGQVNDPVEIQFLQRRLKLLESRSQP